MKAAFGPALPVGTAGKKEYFDVWLTRYTDAQEALSSLRAAAPSDLAPLAAGYVSDREKSLTATLTIGTYVVGIDGEELSAEKVHMALADVLSAGELGVEHKGKTKVFDLARSVPKDARVTDREGGADVALAIRMGPEGSLRPEALIRAALERAGISASAVHTTRTDTLVEGDEGVWSRPV